MFSKREKRINEIVARDESAEFWDTMFSEREKQINSLPYGDLVRSYEEGSLIMYVDRGSALRAALRGLPTSALARTTAIGFPISIIAAIGLVFWSIWAAIAALIIGFACFRISRAETVRCVRSTALENQKIFDILRKDKTIWFEEVERHG